MAELNLCIIYFSYMTSYQRYRLRLQTIAC